MFDKISERRFQHLASDFVKSRDKLNRLFDKTTELPGEVRRLRIRVCDLEIKNVSTTTENERKINNLIEVIKALAKPADLNKVIAVGDDDTDITVNDILDANGLVPECEPEVPVREEEGESDGPNRGFTFGIDTEEGKSINLGEPETGETEPSNGETKSDSSTDQIY